jgi:outer membrane biosynthesis protein TonB
MQTPRLAILASLIFVAACGPRASEPRSPEPEQEPNAEPSAAPDDDLESSPDSESTASDPTPPPGRSPTEGHRSPAETRTTQVIADVIQTHRDEARACFDKAARDVPGLAGDLVIQFVLEPDGSVRSAELNPERSTLTHPAVVNCVIDVIRRLPFPESSRGMETRVNYPFNFKP